MEGCDLAQRQNQPMVFYWYEDLSRHQHARQLYRNPDVSVDAQ